MRWALLQKIWFLANILSVHNYLMIQQNFKYFIYDYFTSQNCSFRMYFRVNWEKESKVFLEMIEFLRWFFKNHYLKNISIGWICWFSWPNWKLSQSTIISSLSRFLPCIFLHRIRSYRIRIRARKYTESLDIARRYRVQRESTWFHLRYQLTIILHPLEIWSLTFVRCHRPVWVRSCAP